MNGIDKVAQGAKVDLLKAQEAGAVNDDSFWQIVVKHFKQNQSSFTSLESFKRFVEISAQGTGFWAGPDSIYIASHWFGRYEGTLNKWLLKSGICKIKEYEWHKETPALNHSELRIASHGLIRDIKDLVCKKDCSRISDVSFFAIVGEKLNIEESVFYKFATHLKEMEFIEALKLCFNGCCSISNVCNSQDGDLLLALRRGYAGTMPLDRQFKFGDGLYKDVVK